MTWIGDHDPPHVHVYEGDRLILKWDLQDGKPLQGAASRKLERLIEELIREGRL